MYIGTLVGQVNKPIASYIVKFDGEITQIHILHCVSFKFLPIVAIYYQID